MARRSVRAAKRRGFGTCIPAGYRPSWTTCAQKAWLLLGKAPPTGWTISTRLERPCRAQALDSENPAPCLAIAELKAQMGLYES